jgi:hypothetical protein
VYTSWWQAITFKTGRGKIEQQTCSCVYWQLWKPEWVAMYSGCAIRHFTGKQKTLYFRDWLCLYHQGLGVTIRHWYIISPLVWYLFLVGHVLRESKIKLSNPHFPWITSSMILKLESGVLWQSVTLHFEFMGFVWLSLQTAIISLNSINHLIFVMVKCGVLFEVQTEYLTI